MWANSVWGFFSLSVSLALATLGLPSEYAFLQPWFLRAAGISLFISGVIFCKPLVRNRLFPTAAPPHEPDVSLLEAIWRVYLGHWGIPENAAVDAGGDKVKNFQRIVERDFRQLAFEGKLPLWARKPPRSGVREEVPKEVWKEHHIDYLTAWPPGHPWEVMAVPDNPYNKSGIAGWREFMTSSAVVDRLWPSRLNGLDLLRLRLKGIQSPLTKG
jgi:hypothetical protein